MNRTVCITGTTRGIGLEFAKQYVEADWEVLACSRHPKASALQDLKKQKPLPLLLISDKHNVIVDFRLHFAYECNICQVYNLNVMF